MSAVLVESQVTYTAPVEKQGRYRLASAVGKTVVEAIINLEVKVNELKDEGFYEFECVQVVDGGGTYTAIQALVKPAQIG